MEKVVNMHAETFAIAKRFGEGPELRIPFIDSLPEMSITAFARYCMSKSVKQAGEFSTDFSSCYSQARSVVLRLNGGTLWNEVAEDRQRSILTNAIRDQCMASLNTLITLEELDGNIDFLVENLNTMSPLYQAIYRFIGETQTPLFLILENLGAPFADESKSLVNQLEDFLHFCQYSLSPLLMIPKLFILMLGEVPFLKLIQKKTSCAPPTGGSGVNIERIGMSGSGSLNYMHGKTSRTHP